MLNELTEGLKTVVMAGIGAVAVTAEKSREIVDELVKKGELTLEQGKVLNEELKHNIKNKVKETVTVSVVRDARPADLIEQVEHMSPEELATLKAKLAAMEETHETVDGDAAGDA